MTQQKVPPAWTKPPSRVAFIKGNLTAILVWPVGCLTLAIAIWVITLSIIQSDHEFIERNARKNASYIATSFAQQLTRLLDQADQTAIHLRLDWRQSNGRLKLDTLQGQGLFPHNGLLSATILNRQGDVVTSTRNIKTGVNVAQMAYFLTQRNATEDQLHIGPLMSGGLFDKPTIQLSRRLQDASGAFDGVIVISAESAYFTAFFDSASLGQADLLAVMDKEGGMRGSRIGNTLYPADSPAIRKMPMLVPAQRGVIVASDNTIFADGEGRYLAWQALSAYPFVTLIGLSEQQLLAPYVDTWDTYRQGAMIASIFLLVLSLIGIVMSVRMAQRHYQSEEIKRTYRIATEGGNEGFYMLRGLFDSEQHLTDFLIEDCNERGALLIGKTREQLIGSRFTEHNEGIHQKIMLGVFRKAMQSGFYEDEFEVIDDSPLHGTWLHRRLVRADTGLAMTLRDISALKNHNTELTRVANEDALTSLPSRHWLTSFLPAAIERNANAGTMLALLFVDLDGFKSVNDTLGHAAGDELLQQAAKRLQSVLRPGDHVVRLGGDEFTAILEPIMSENDATRVAVRIVEAFNRPFELSQGIKSVGTSVGISLFPRDGQESDALLRNADIAMYRAKSEGKNQYRMYEKEAASA
ncbi:diguanylate cyclase [Actimicrobium sp. CCC2.4]|uniref:bifunctional diguanylate cyclase/phosphodiesterase n=1 Tax=Actimicrobium sp. CCC2.4 TaxID=3048606 RepID=UPI002AC8D6A5|nr:diguanylate cyclase [Actimicrobium sp. CCC2.4]MEB0135096.1 diguanylate cyclase [Actimicrobium sp. CCC2.4]WPX31857.1 diguanylate cyclase [Actimicrobium sp. CCC2.4]